MSSPVVLVLGAGGNVGLSVAKKFKAEGWKVAAVARTPKDDIKASSDLTLSADFTDPESVTRVFDELETKLGIPSVVVYNAYFATFGDGADPFAGVSVADYAKGFSANTVSAYAAAKLALAGFKKLPANAPKVYIYTGNMESSLIVPEVMTLGSGKNASLYFLETAAHAYGKDYHFYFADERMLNGGPSMDKIDGDAHGEEYWKLANTKEQGPVNYTFVKGKGFVRFEMDRQREMKRAEVLMKDAHRQYEEREKGDA